MKDIDEAIQHCEDVAQQQDMLKGRYDDASGYTRSGNEAIRTSDAKKCEKCAADHRQLAEWLKDYKRLLELQSCEDAISRQAVLNLINADWKYEGLEEDVSSLPPVTPQKPTDKLNLKKTCEELAAENDDLRDQLAIRDRFKQKTNTGHWLIKDGKEQGYDIGGIKTWYIQIKCSECGFIKTAIEGRIGQYHYCPACGAKMRVEKYKDCFQPNSNEKPNPSQQDHNEDIAKAFQLGISFGFMDGLKANTTQESEE